MDKYTKHRFFSALVLEKRSQILTPWGQMMGARCSRAARSKVFLNKIQNGGRWFKLDWHACVWGEEGHSTILMANSPNTIFFTRLVLILMCGLYSYIFCFNCGLRAPGGGQSYLATLITLQNCTKLLFYTLPGAIYIYILWGFVRATRSLHDEVPGIWLFFLSFLQLLLLYNLLSSTLLY